MAVATNRPRKRRTVSLPLAFVLILAPSPVAAPLARADCLVDYADCVDRASDLDSFVQRSLAGLGCFTDLISCLQRRLA